MCRDLDWVGSLTSDDGKTPGMVGVAVGRQHQGEILKKASLIEPAEQTFPIADGPGIHEDRAVLLDDVGIASSESKACHARLHVILRGRIESPVMSAGSYSAMGT